MSIEKRTTPRTPDPGFLGATSFSDVYAKDLANLQHDHQNESNNGFGERLYLANRDTQVRRGMTCLSFLTDMPKYETLLQTWHSTFCSTYTLMNPFIDSLQASIRISLYDDLVAIPVREREPLLFQQSTQIWQVSLEDMNLPDNCTINQYSNILSNRAHLRWVALGLYFAAVGLAAVYASDSAPHKVFAERRQLAKHMLEASDMCISFCEELGDMSDAETWLYSENAHLASIVEGDASYMFWRRLGDLISACITTGLHTEIEVSQKVPFWLSEMRKRTFSHAYILDKSISSFMGRPPRLARKYCSMQLPLDIKSEHLWLQEAQLEAELDTLDQQGWNTAGEIRINLYSRTQLICSMIQEDILEFALASVQHNSLTVAEDILRRSQAAWASLPGWITMPRKANQNSEIPYLTSEISINFKYSEFLLYRAVVKRFPSAHASEELLRISSEVLTLVMEDVNHGSAVGRYNCDLPWILAKFALPAAGVLGLELLRQLQSPEDTKARVASSFKRSAVIQTLSNLVAALGSVLPLDGDYGICNQARLALQRILDRVLDPQPAIADIARQNRNRTKAQSFSKSAGLWLDQPWSEPDFWTSLPTHPLFMTQRT